MNKEHYEKKLTKPKKAFRRGNFMFLARDKREERNSPFKTQGIFKNDK